MGVYLNFFVNMTHHKMILGCDNFCPRTIVKAYLRINLKRKFVNLVPAKPVSLVISR